MSARVYSVAKTDSPAAHNLRCLWGAAMFSKPAYQEIAHSLRLFDWLGRTMAFAERHRAQVFLLAKITGDMLYIFITQCPGDVGHRQIGFHQHLRDQVNTNPTNLP